MGPLLPRGTWSSACEVLAQTCLAQGPCLQWQKPCLHLQNCSRGNSCLCRGSLYRGIQASNHSFSYHGLGCGHEQGKRFIKHFIIQKNDCSEEALWETGSPGGIEWLLVFFISVLTGRGITKEQNLTKQNLSFLLGAKQSWNPNLCPHVVAGSCWLSLSHRELRFPGKSCLAPPVSFGHFHENTWPGAWGVLVWR